MPPAGFVKVSGNRRFEYVSRGTGPATLLVHPGGPGFTYHYLRTILKLADSHLRVILFNPRGVGHSWTPARPSAYTIENQADDIEAIRRALDIKELHLLGYSAGGFTALEYAHRFPTKLTSLLMCSTAGGAADLRVALKYVLEHTSPVLRLRLRELTKSGDFASKEYRELVTRIMAPFSERFSASPPPDLRATKLSEEVYHAMLTRTGDEFVVDGTIARWDGRKYYSKIFLPMLVLVGRYDYLLDASIDMANRIRTAHLRILPRSSHYPVLEQPREFLGQISEFLEDVTGD
jgi:proline iminopeptidase